MKRIFLLWLVGMAALPGCASSQAAPSQPPQPVQAFSAVVWTTTTLQSPSGPASVFMRRTIYYRDASGTVRRELYQPTKGLQHDVTAPLERVLTGSTSAQTLPLAQSSGETLVEEDDLGTQQFFGVPATGRRQTFRDASGRHTHTLETWFSATLGLVVHMENVNTRGDTVLSDLSELHLGDQASPSGQAIPAPRPEIPLLNLYRSLFTLIAHMERDRLANDPTRHVDMDEIEDHLRKKLTVSTNDWKVLVDKSVKVDTYTREVSKQARVIMDQDREARRGNPIPADTPSAGRAALHKMQLDLNAHVQGEIDELKKAVGPTQTDKIQAYLQGPLAASTSVVPLKSARSRAQKERQR